MRSDFRESDLRAANALWFAQEELQHQRARLWDGHGTRSEVARALREVREMLDAAENELKRENDNA